MIVFQLNENVSFVLYSLLRTMSFAKFDFNCMFVSRCVKQFRQTVFDFVQIQNC